MGLYRRNVTAFVLWPLNHKMETMGLSVQEKDVRGLGSRESF